MTNFVYDPKRQGYDTTLWKSLTGVPAIAADKIVLNAGSTLSYSDLMQCDLKVTIEIPLAPAAFDSRSFGFANVSKGAYLMFNINGVDFTGYANDGEGHTKILVFSFDPTWAGTAVTFGIKWRAGYADFSANGVNLISTEDTGTYRMSNIAVPSEPMGIYFSNANADNMKIGMIEAKNIQGFIK